MVDKDGRDPFGVLNLFDYGASHLMVQQDLLILYGWEIEIYVDGPDGRGRMDLYDRESNEFYEVKSVGVAYLPSTQKQMNKYATATTVDRRPTSSSPRPGTKRVSGFFTYGIYDVSYWSVPEIPGLIAYSYQLNYSRAFAIYGMALVSAIILVASEGTALPELALWWGGTIYAYG